MTVPCNGSCVDDNWTTWDFWSCFSMCLCKKCLIMAITGDLVSLAVLTMPWQILTRDCTTSSKLLAFAWNKRCTITPNINYSNYWSWRNQLVILVNDTFYGFEEAKVYYYQTSIRSNHLLSSVVFHWAKSLTIL